MRKLTHGILLVILLAGCSNSETEDLPAHISGLENLTAYPLGSEPLSTIKLTPEQHFGSTEELSIGRTSEIDVDPSGRVFITEATQGHAAVHIFRRDGTYSGTLGGYGEGPGEFLSIINPQVAGDTFYALDGIQLKIQAFSLETLAYDYAIPLNPDSWSQIDDLQDAFPAEFTALRDETFLIGFSKLEGHENLVLRYKVDKNGTIISDKILEQVESENFITPDQKAFYYSPFSSRGLIAVSDDDRLFSVRTGNILIKEHDSAGNYLHSFYHPFNNRKLDRDHVLNLYDDERYKKAVRNTGNPDTWPALHSLVIDDENRFWISTIGNDQDLYDWWVLNETGELIATFTWPKNNQIQVVQNGFLYTVEADEDTDLQDVVRYRVEVGM